MNDATCSPVRRADHRGVPGRPRGARRVRRGPAVRVRAALPGRSEAAGRERRRAHGCVRRTQGSRARRACSTVCSIASASRPSQSSTTLPGCRSGPCGRHRLHHRRRVDGCIGGLREALGAAGQELVAQFAGPCERRQHAHRLGDIVEDLGCLAVAVGRRLVGHRRTVAGNGASQRRIVRVGLDLRARSCRRRRRTCVVTSTAGRTCVLRPITRSTLIVTVDVRARPPNGEHVRGRVEQFEVAVERRLGRPPPQQREQALHDRPCERRRRSRRACSGAG